jgi:hypothetical protein
MHQYYNKARSKPQRRATLTRHNFPQPVSRKYVRCCTALHLFHILMISSPTIDVLHATYVSTSATFRRHDEGFVISFHTR